MAQKTNKNNERKRLGRMLNNFCLLDDTFMRAVFQKNAAGAALLLRIILQDDSLAIKEYSTQKELYNLENHSIRTDLYAETEDGSLFNVEVQRKNISKMDEWVSLPKRSRYYGSMLVVNKFDAGETYSKVPDTTVIFILDEDYFGKGAPVYYVDRHVSFSGDESKPDLEKVSELLPFGDGEHILMVNGQYKNDATPLGRLMSDFRAKNPDEMYYPELRNPVRFFKETMKGREDMCIMMEEYGNERWNEGKQAGLIEGEAIAIEAEQRKTIRTLSDMGHSVKEIVDWFGYPEDRVREVVATV